MDKFIEQIDVFLKTVFPPENRHTSRNVHWKYDADTTKFSQQQKKNISGLMRVNHCGEVCAQALYMGQAATAKLPNIVHYMQISAQEEVDHLAWCEKRLQELHSSPSKLNALWYAGSWLIGAIAGWCGDNWSLGFVVETERQVSLHLESHIQSLPSDDLHTKEILAIMMADENNHAEVAKNSGAIELPGKIKDLMRLVSKFMTTVSYYI